jgi:hypothetical protein
VCDQSGRKKTSVELADVFLQYADTYIEQHGVSAAQNKAIKAISRCRTSALGGHVACCNHCGAKEISYNSCRYRHCPKCQTMKQVRWLENRKKELLPVNYFHVVFTLPHELNNIASYNPAVIYNLLFKAAWSTVYTLGKDKKRLAGLTGMMSFLHTWGQNLSQHIHLHCMIPGGALCDVGDQKKWHPSKSGFLFPVKVMSKLFGKIFLTLLQQAFLTNELRFKGVITDLSEPKIFAKLAAQLATKSWNVYAKKPFNGAEGGMEYLARYVTKTAISNERILSCDNNQVTFKWRDYSDRNKSKIMTLDANEFIRRYLSHVLPNGFMRVRSFGFLANACKAKNINLIRALLNHEKSKESSDSASLSEAKLLESKFVKSSSHAPDTTSCAQKTTPETCKESAVELIKRVTGVDVELCKQCKIGRLEIVKSFSGTTQPPIYLDPS